MHLTLWYVVLVCHQYDVCNDYVASVDVGWCGGLSESRPCVFRELCPVGFLVVCEVRRFVVVMPFVDCGDDR